MFYFGMLCAPWFQRQKEQLQSDLDAWRRDDVKSIMEPHDQERLAKSAGGLPGWPSQLSEKNVGLEGCACESEVLYM